jgi:Icc-related predicted phosphoesterase
MKIVCISDTHFYPVTKEIPDGDILIHAGDLTSYGTIKQVAAAGNWLGRLPHPIKLVVPGNHDHLFEKDPTLARQVIGEGKNGIEVLIHQMTVHHGLVFWGSPWSAKFQNWAFGLSGSHAAAEWAKLPSGIDVLITHGPAEGILDSVRQKGNYAPEHLGEAHLRHWIRNHYLKLHVFGHIHDSHGQVEIDGTTHVNAAICDESYNHTFDPIVVEL